MAELLYNMAGNLLGKINKVAGRSEMWPEIRSELRKLEMIVSSLKPVLRDAEEKQANDSKLKLLLQQLKDAFSQANGLIDDFECDYLKRGNDVGGKVHWISCFISSFNVSACKTADKINQINERLDSIEKTLFEFRLAEEENDHIKRLKCEMTLRTSITGSQVFARLLHSKKEAILSDNNDSIIGREKEKNVILEKLLTHGDPHEQQSLAILSIHGDGGMGKTTLARLVYNTKEVFDYFDKRMWVCVSEDFDVRRIKRELLSSATGEQVSDALTERHLQIRLQRNLFGRKFLLVLDDFGCLNAERESELEEILKMGAKGSKIIITTRSEQTLNDAALKIETLKEENSTFLFKEVKNIIISVKHPEKLLEKLSEKNPEEFPEVAKELVGISGGVPLAIKCLAGLFCSSNAAKLAKVIKEKKNDCILPALRMSYDLMPSYLKRCFLCFSLLPKDYVFYSVEIIQLWMAQGILHKDSKNPEVVGERYFKELSYRGLLEDVEEHALGYWFKIHSLVHDLAVQLAEKEQKDLGTLRHLSFVDSNNKDDLNLSVSGEIHCLSVPVGGVEPKINGVSLVKCISKFKQLRFLYLCNSSLEEIPTSIGTLKHLRYLDLRGNRRIKRLPESICQLQSLQTLILAFCSELEELPRNIKNMINLRLLWITTRQARLGKDGIGSLTSLHFLAIGGSQNLTHLFEDIDKLKSLRTLIIYDCKSLLTLPQGLKNLSELRNMALWGCEKLTFTFSESKLCLKKLILRGIPRFLPLPSWIKDARETLKVLEIGELPMLRKLPSWLTDLWGLRMLRISNCPRLEGGMPRDFPYGCDLVKELSITFCGSLSNLSKNKNNHGKLDISFIGTIYVDSRKIKKPGHDDVDVDDDDDDDDDDDEDEDENEDEDIDDDDDHEDENKDDDDDNEDENKDDDEGTEGGHDDNEDKNKDDDKGTGGGHGGDGGKINDDPVGASEDGPAEMVLTGEVKLDGASDTGHAWDFQRDNGHVGDGQTTIVVTRQGF